MSVRTKFFGSFLVAGAALLWSGCGSSTPPPKGGAAGHPAGEKGHKEGDGHAHEGAAHAEEGPHHGHLIELGKEEYHAELTHDEASKTVTVYLLDGAAKSAVPIADAEIIVNLVVEGKPAQFKLPAKPQEGDPEGQASCFSLADEALLEALEAPKTTGRLNVKIKGKEFVGNVEHHEHGEHKDK